MSSVLGQMGLDPSLAGPSAADRRGEGHGAGAMGQPPRRGILVSVKMLKSKGLNLGGRERERAPMIVVDLKIRRVHDRYLEFQSIADLFQFDTTPHSPNRFFPSRLTSLINPEFDAVDERGMIIYGIERGRTEDGGMVSYWQTWQVIFGVAAPESPAHMSR